MPSEKKQYKKPQLIKYGDIATLTRNTNTKGSTDSAGGSSQLKKSTI